MKKIITVFAAVLAAAILFSACGAVAGNTPNPWKPEGYTPESPAAVGAVLLSVNPEIEIEYDKSGIVVALEGRNDHGREILLTYTDFEGKTAQQVVEELIALIYAAGTYELDMNGNPKNFVIKTEKGSYYPDDDFLEDIAESARKAIKHQGGKSDAVVVGENDLNGNGMIGMNKARELVLAQLGLTDANFTKQKFDQKDSVYELEFIADSVEYEFEVDGRTGKILEVDINNDLPASGSITADEAKAAVFTHLNITEDQVTKLKCKYDEGKFEIEFYLDGVEYEVDVNAATGEILKVKKDNDRPAVTPPQGSITLEDAKAIVFNQLGISESQVKGLKCKFDEGKYEIDFYYDGMEYDVDVSAATGDILKIEKEKDYPDNDRDDIPAPGMISAEDAKAAVFKHLGITESQVTALKCEYDDGKYEVEFRFDGMEYDVDVNAATGAIIEVDKERD